MTPLEPKLSLIRALSPEIRDFVDEDLARLRGQFYRQLDSYRTLWEIQDGFLGYLCNVFNTFAHHHMYGLRDGEDVRETYHPYLWDLADDVVEYAKGITPPALDSPEFYRVLRTTLKGKIFDWQSEALRSVRELVRGIVDAAGLPAMTISHLPPADPFRRGELVHCHVEADGSPVPSTSNCSFSPEMVRALRASVRPAVDIRNTPGTGEPVSEQHVPAAQTRESSKQVPPAATPTRQVSDPGDFASEAARAKALADYIAHWTCSEAALARTAPVNPADLSKWKKGLLPAGSEKKARIEKALRNNDAPVLLAKRPAN